MRVYIKTPYMLLNSCVQLLVCRDAPAQPSRFCFPYSLIFFSAAASLIIALVQNSRDCVTVGKQNKAKQTL